MTDFCHYRKIIRATFRPPRLCLYGTYYILVAWQDAYVDIPLFVIINITIFTTSTTTTILIIINNKFIVVVVLRIRESDFYIALSVDKCRLSLHCPAYETFRLFFGNDMPLFPHNLIIHHLEIVSTITFILTLCV